MWSAAPTASAAATTSAQRGRDTTARPDWAARAGSPRSEDPGPGSVRSGTGLGPGGQHRASEPRVHARAGTGHGEVRDVVRAHGDTAASGSGGRRSVDGVERRAG